MVDLLQSAPCGIFSFNDAGVFLQANDTFCSLVQMSREELLHQKVSKVFTLASAIFYQTHFYPLLKMQKTADEIFLTLKTGKGEEVPVLLGAKRLETENGVENVCSCLPIHNRKSYEDKLIAAKTGAEKALRENLLLAKTKAELQLQVKTLDEKMFLLEQRNEELKELNSSITHDLQEPIRKLNLYSDLLLHQKSGVPSEEVLRKILPLTQRIKALLLGLQDYMWLMENDALKLRKADLNNVVLIARQKVAAENRDTPFDVETTTLPVLQADFEQLVILFYQLFSNSIKFHLPGRPLKIKIESTLVRRNNFRTLKDHYHYSDHYKLIYSDNGIGFDQRYKDQIFQLFRKLDRQSKGLGLGLAISKKIVANHKGMITAQGKEGEGSSFVLYFPAEPHAPAPDTDNS